MLTPAPAGTSMRVWPRSTGARRVCVIGALPLIQSAWTVVPQAGLAPKLPRE